MPGEKSSLLAPGGRGTSTAGAQSGVLRWTSSEVGGKALQVYPMLVPWEIMITAAVMGPTVVVLLSTLWPAGGPQGVARGSGALLDASDPSPMGLWAAGLVSLLCALAVFVLTPRRVVREKDAFAVEFPLHRSVVSARDVLELGMCDCTYRVCELLGRWGAFPFGLTPRFLSGFPSGQGAMCVLLTNRCFWSFVFSLEHDVAIQFLVDSQKPLDKGVKYQTTQRVLVREGESFETKKVGHLRSGVFMRVEEQRGRRCLMTTEHTQVHGWISHINSMGYFLLTKVEDCPVPGAVGASQLATSYGSAIELCTMEGDDDE